MKIYSKLLRKIRNNKTRVKKAIGIVTVAIGLRYGKINSIPTNLLSNSNQQVEQVQNYVEEDMQVINRDNRVKDGLSHKSSSYLIKTGSGILIGNQQISEGSKSALIIRSGDLGKSGPGPRAKADALRNAKAGKFSSGSTIIPGANGFVPQQTYCRYHENAPLSCRLTVKVSDGPFQGDGDNNQPPPEDGKFDASQYKGGPNPFIDKFDYDNPNYTRENTDFSSQKRMNHAYDRHAEKCFGMKENRNKENLKKFEVKARSFIESPETEKINGSYRYQTPAYFYKEKDGNLVAIGNATENSFITVVNATESQLKSIREDNNFGLDTRPSMQLTLRLKGPKNHN